MKRAKSSAKPTVRRRSNTKKTPKKREQSEDWFDPSPTSPLWKIAKREADEVKEQLIRKLEGNERKVMSSVEREVNKRLEKHKRELLELIPSSDDLQKVRECVALINATLRPLYQKLKDEEALKYRGMAG